MPWAVVCPCNPRDHMGGHFGNPEGIISQALVCNCARGSLALIHAGVRLKGPINGSWKLGHQYDAKLLSILDVCKAVFVELMKKRIA